MHQPACISIATAHSRRQRGQAGDTTTSRHAFDVPAEQLLSSLPVYAARSGVGRWSYYLIDDTNVKHLCCRAQTRKRSTHKAFWPGRHPDKMSTAWQVCGRVCGQRRRLAARLHTRQRAQAGIAQPPAPLGLRGGHAARARSAAQDGQPPCQRGGGWAARRRQAGAQDAHAVLPAHQHQDAVYRLFDKPSCLPANQQEGSFALLKLKTRTQSSLHREVLTASEPAPRGWGGGRQACRTRTQSSLQ